MSFYADMTVNDRNPLKRRLQRLRLTHSLQEVDHLPTHYTGKIWDLGAGDGILCQRMAERFPHAFIVCHEPVAVLRQHAIDNLQAAKNVWVAGDYVAVGEYTFDYVFCLEVLEHLPRPEMRFLLNEVLQRTNPLSTVVFGVPNEIFLPGLCKGLFRAGRRYGSFDARWSNIARATCGRPPLRRPLQEISPGQRYYYHHLGFDYRRLVNMLRKQFRIERIYGSPRPGLPLWLNSEVYIVCRPLPAQANKRPAVQTPTTAAA